MRDALLALRPELEGELHAQRDNAGRNQLVMTLLSPRGDHELRLWMDDGEPSVAFGGWHTHASVWAATHASDDNECQAIADLVDAILTDRVVLLAELGGEHGEFCEAIDLREEDAIPAALTSKYATGRARVLSWTGATDREWSLDDL